MGRKFKNVREAHSKFTATAFPWIKPDISAFDANYIANDIL